MPDKSRALKRNLAQCHLRLGAPALSTASRVIGRYELDDAMRPIKSPLGIGPLSGRYLGDQARAIFTARERRARGN